MKEIIIEIIYIILGFLGVCIIASINILNREAKGLVLLIFGVCYAVFWVSYKISDRKRDVE